MSEAVLEGTRPFAALRHREFASFCGAALASTVGAWMQLITVPYVINQRTGSTAMVGLGALLALLPTALFAPLAGSLADRIPRRTLMLWTQTITAACAMTLWVLWVSGTFTTGALLALVAIGAAARGMSMGAWHAFVADLVPPESLLGAVRINQALFVAGRAIGPSIAGVLLAAAGPGAAFFVNGVACTVVGLVVLTIRPRSVTRVDGERAGLAHYWKAIQYAWARPTLRLAVALSVIFMGVGTGIMNLAEPFTADVLDVGPAAYGLFYGAYGFGSVLVTPFVLVRGAKVRRSRQLAWGLSAFAIASTALGVSPGYAFAIACALVMGAANTPVQMSLQTALQYYVDDEHRGRVTSMYTVAAFGGAPTSSLVAGLAAEVVGLRATFVANGLVFAGLAAAAVVVGGGLAQLDRPADADAPLAPTHVPTRLVGR